MHQFIDGELRIAKSGETCDNINPSSGQSIGEIDLAGPEDVEDAVQAAKRAQPDWAKTTPSQRSEILYRIADLIEKNQEDWAQIESREAGKPIRFAREFDIPVGVDTARFFAGAARNLEGKAAAEYSGEHTSYLRRDPIGVVGAITPWNFPLAMAAWKIMPAIAAGNAIVIKPSELTPTTTLRLAQVCVEAGVPAGVVNVVVGTGQTAGEALASHSDVGMVAFTGSSAIGRQVMSNAAPRNARVHLELGGKAPFVVFDDANLEAAIHGAVAGSVNNVGQDCAAATRAYIQRPLYDEFITGVAELMDAIVIGPTDDSETDLGPLISGRHRDGVAAAVDKAISEGARVIRGGAYPRSAPDAGFYYEPTLIVDADQSSAIVQNEVFGPVLVVLPFDDDDEGFALANDTSYGLVASAWTTNVFRAGRAARELRAGTVWINDHLPTVTEMPHGGINGSGFGKDMSTYAFDDYSIVRHIMSENTGASIKDWHRVIFTLPQGK